MMRKEAWAGVVAFLFMIGAIVAWGIAPRFQVMQGVFIGALLMIAVLVGFAIGDKLPRS